MDETSHRPTKLRKLNTGEVGNPRTHSRSPQSSKDEEQAEGGQAEQLDEISQDDETALSKETPTTPSISKSQLKKLRKKQEWEAGREERKIKRREKDKEKKARKAAEREEAALTAPPRETQSDQRRPIHQRPIQVPITLLLDCGFDELMTDKEIMSLSSQLTRCYSDNKSARYRSHLVVSSFGGNLQARFEGILAGSHRSWRAVEFTDQDFLAAAQDAHSFMSGPEGGNITGALEQGPRELDPTDQRDRVNDTASQIGNGLGNDCDTIVAGRPNTSNHEENNQDESTETTADHSIVDVASEANKPSPASPADATLPTLASEPTTTSNPSPTNHPTMPSTSAPFIVYLTSDSPHTLTQLSPHTTYVIGGLVDKNRHKGICYKRARARNVATAKLPIGEYMTMQSRTVLATNHVVEIMLKWLECGDWGEAFLRVIPKRKEARLKVRRRDGEDEDEDEDGEVDDGEVKSGNVLDGGVDQREIRAGSGDDEGDGVASKADVQEGQAPLATADKVEAIKNIRQVLDVEHTTGT